MRRRSILPTPLPRASTNGWRSKEGSERERGFEDLRGLGARSHIALRCTSCTSEQLRKLRVRSELGGQSELKSGAPAGSAGSPQAAAMRLNDRTTDGQPHTSPIILGREECLEDLFRLLLAQSHTGIAN